MRLQSQSSTLFLSKHDVLLLGIKNSLNMVFTTPDKFYQTLYRSIRIFFNGQRYLVGIGNDYTVSESGGPGTGFDTVTLLSVAPRPLDILTADYEVNF
jgi:hypothetical protein